MRRFNFKLEKVLRLRENREQETKLELGKAIGVLSALELQIKNLIVEKAAASQNRYSSNNSFFEMRSIDLYILRLDQTKEILLKKAALAEIEVEKARTIYLEASRDRKIISKLKERQEQEYRHTMNLEEIKAIDDISGGIAARKAVAV